MVTVVYPLPTSLYVHPNSKAKGYVGETYRLRYASKGTPSQGDNTQNGELHENRLLRNLEIWKKSHLGI